jgi:hypothetical protein
MRNNKKYKRDRNTRIKVVRQYAYIYILKPYRLHLGMHRFARPLIGDTLLILIGRGCASSVVTLKKLEC